MTFKASKSSLREGERKAHPPYPETVISYPLAGLGLAVFHDSPDS